MSPEEIEKELLKDHNEIFNHFNGRWNRIAIEIRKRLINNRSMKFPYSFWKELKTKTGNTWKIRAILESRKDVKTGWATITEICTYNTSHGKYAIMIINTETIEQYGRLAFNIYSPHLFQRYRERYNLGEQVHTDKIIEGYFENNSAAALVQLDKNNEGNIQNGLWMCRDGAIFGISYSKYHYLLKTFIDDSLFKSDQEEKKKILKENFEWFKEIIKRPDIQKTENFLHL